MRNYTSTRVLPFPADLEPVNPALLRSKDINAFQIVRDYANALNANNDVVAIAIRENNPDLNAYFLWCLRQEADTISF